jgi:tetratricopeptide (TPR) repeat protein
MLRKTLLLFLFLVPLCLHAQSNKEAQARMLMDSKEYDKAAAAYKDLYAQNPANDDIYNEYMYVLMELKDYKNAETLAKTQFSRNSANPLFLIDLGNVYKADNKVKKAEEQFDQALKYVDGDDDRTQKLGNAFSNSGNDGYAIKVYERASELTQSPFFYSAPLSRLYSRTGQTEKAITAIVNNGQYAQAMRGEESTEAMLLEITGKDPEKLRMAQKAIIKLINSSSPDNFYYTYLLIWVFSLQDSWDQALIQVTALEKRSNDKGRTLMDFATMAARQQQYETAIKAYETVIAYGNSNPRYKTAKEALLNLKLTHIREDASYTQADVLALAKDYAAFLEEFPQSMYQPLVNDYALLLAQYADSVNSAIALLKTAIAYPGGNKFFIGESKLQLGDYYIIAGKVWDAALTYSQVDKAFREDALGEEARYKNARLSYYRGDFEMAQGQLSVLKASTSELIANDALFLSVLITENMTPDSNLVPLERFAYADLLLFQNKDQEAATLLDSISKAFPKHPLSDDILMAHATIAAKHRDYAKAIDYLKTILEQYGKDVLADDALFRIANIYRDNLKQPEHAKKYYEQLIIDYPGSTYVQAARSYLSGDTPAN